MKGMKGGYSKKPHKTDSMDYAAKPMGKPAKGKKPAAGKSGSRAKTYKL